MGIDALDGKVAAEGWLEQSQVDYVDFAKEMESLGVQYLICTDIHQDGTMNGPNLVMLDKLNRAVHCHIIASGGRLQPAGHCQPLRFGAVRRHRREVFVHRRPGPAHRHHRLPQDFPGKNAAGDMPEDELDLYFTKSDLLPAIIQDDDTNEVLMLAYMNRESFRKSLETGYTWFYSRSRKTFVEQGGDLRPYPENRQRLFRLRRRHLAHSG